MRPRKDRILLSSWDISEAIYEQFKWLLYIINSRKMYKKITLGGVIDDWAFHTNISSESKKKQWKRNGSIVTGLDINEDLGELVNDVETLIDLYNVVKNGWNIDPEAYYDYREYLYPIIEEYFIIE